MVSMAATHARSTKRPGRRLPIRPVIRSVDTPSNGLIIRAVPAPEDSSRFFGWTDRQCDVPCSSLCSCWCWGWRRSRRSSSSRPRHTTARRHSSSWPGRRPPSVPCRLPPFRASETTGGSREIARDLINRSEHKIDETITDLQRSSSPAALRRVSTPLHQNYATLERIFALGVADGYGRAADRLSAVAAGEVRHEIMLANRAYKQRSVVPTSARQSVQR